MCGFPATYQRFTAQTTDYKKVVHVPPRFFYFLILCMSEQVEIYILQ
jgi:hypothetical protein